ncbi:hypothetical protein [Thalassobacter stenotrophicus]|uniref:Uncharacterized protein n=2 Tax=Thalassobacter stenotrophicus TaxID=266809 RepID=A0A0P1EYZ3_9RHOB|nr:hypothetical protein [Thalassobacter stenotrophicus]CUH60252.1 hypothetical protein THS5294_01541 [Thalassobacter stenotrophicus]SHI71250.1 hypothetical protein SAMN02744035_01332 [Thalassobacter stenotrophicus DSM 16310]
MAVKYVRSDHDFVELEGILGGIHEKGKKFDDGVTRYYDPAKHKWVTQDEIKHQSKLENASSVMVIVAAVVLGGGGFLWMVAQTFF